MRVRLEVEKTPMRVVRQASKMIDKSAVAFLHSFWSLVIAIRQHSQ